MLVQSLLKQVRNIKKNIKYGQYSAPEVTKEQSLC